VVSEGHSSALALTLLDWNIIPTTNAKNKHILFD